MAGDFNAHHQAWGYPHTTHKGVNLWQAAAYLGLTLIPYSNFPTRIGNSVSQDSTPDLTFVGSAGKFSWANLEVELGSDRYIVSTELQVGRKPPRTFKYIDWDHFRKIREEIGGESSENFQDWMASVRGDVEEPTKLIHTELEVSQMDSRLAHLIEANDFLLSWWKTQKLNRRLRKRLAVLNKEIMTHCQVLERQQWQEVCNMVDGQMRIGGKWNLLTHLLHGNETKTSKDRAVDRILHEERQHQGNDEIATRLARRYLPSADWAPGACLVTIQGQISRAP